MPTNPGLHYQPLSDALHFEALFNAWPSCASYRAPNGTTLLHRLAESASDDPGLLELFLAITPNLSPALMNAVSPLGTPFMILLAHIAAGELPAEDFDKSGPRNSFEAMLAKGAKLNATVDFTPV